jgi:formate hydrogenlyase subunit 3/multisubunit Na+/H+ antiporter MnhD subunit
VRRVSINLILTYALLFLSSLIISAFKSKYSIHLSTLLIFSSLIVNAIPLAGILVAGLAELESKLFTDFLIYAMCEVILFVGLMSTLYSIKYFDSELNGRFRLYFAIIPILLATLIGLVSSSNLIYMLFFLEASTALSAILVLYGERRGRAVVSVIVYLAMSILESILIIIGVCLLINGYGLRFDLLDVYMLSRYGIYGWNFKLASYLILLGFGIKAGTSPLALLWLPLVYSEAPSPVSAILSGVATESAYIPILKYVYSLSPIIPMDVGAFITFSGLINIVLGGLGMIIDRDIKRVIAFSSILSMGFLGSSIGLSVSMSGYEAYLCIFGSALYLFAHSIAKALLFLSAGLFVKAFHERNWLKLSMATRSMPITSLIIILGGMSVSGLLPFFSGYYGKHMVMESIIYSGNQFYGIPSSIYEGLIYLSGIIVLCVFLGIVVASARGSGVFREKPDLMFTSIILLALISIIIGIMYHGYLAYGVSLHNDVMFKFMDLW